MVYVDVGVVVSVASVDVVRGVGVLVWFLSDFLLIN
jgi:hypothetical protein